MVVNVNPAQHLERAKQLLAEGKLVDSLAAYQKVIEEDRGSAAEGYYGIGFIKLKLQDSESAATAFRRCLTKDPNHANAAYYLGVIADKENQPDIAQAYYQRALAANPKHAAALKKQRPAADSAHPTHVAQVPPLIRDLDQKVGRDSAPPSYGFYDLLRKDPSPLARQAVELIDALKVTLRPRLSAYLARMIVFVLVPVVGWICLVVLVLRVKSTQVTLDSGRIQISQGVLGAYVTNVELLRVVDLELRQTFWNRMTNDASLILSVETAGRAVEKIEFRGLGKREQLDEMYLKMRNLVLVLRSGNWGKGIIY